MTGRRQRVLVWSIAALSLLLVAAALILYFTSRDRWPQGFNDWGGNVFFTLTLVGPVSLGTIILSRQPQNRYGWLWLAFGLNWSLAVFSEAYVAHAYFLSPGRFPGGPAVALTSVLTFPLGVGLLPLVMVLFPDGQARSWAARLVARLAISLTVLTALLTLLADADLPLFPVRNPAALPGPAGDAAFAVLNIVINFLFFMILLAALALVFRLVHARGVERQQLKWFAFAGTIFGLNLITPFMPLNISPFWRGLLDALSLSGLYIAIGIAILRYRLYDIDFIIRRTLVYTLLTGLLALLYFGGVVALQEVFRALAGQESPAAVVITTLLIAALFNPLRLRLQEAIDRRFYRRKYDTAQTVEAFNAAVRNEVDLQHLVQQLAQVVDTAVQPETVVLWLREERKEQ